MPCRASNVIPQQPSAKATRGLSDAYSRICRCRSEPARYLHLPPTGPVFPGANVLVLVCDPQRELEVSNRLRYAYYTITGKFTQTGIVRDRWERERRNMDVSSSTNVPTPRQKPSRRLKPYTRCVSASFLDSSYTKWVLLTGLMPPC